MLAGRPEWMHRTHANYDPNRIGDISQVRDRRPVRDGQDRVPAARSGGPH